MKYIIPIILLVLIAIIVGTGFHWTVNRVYVEQGQSLQLRYKGPFFGHSNMARKGYWAEEGEVGILKNLRGPGRHFYCPLWWERKIIDDVEIHPGQVGIVTCKLGDDLPAGQFLVDGDIGETNFKGVLRKALSPGRYRVNSYGYEVKTIGTEQKLSGKQTKYGGWVVIPTGFVGVITNLADNPTTDQKKGVQANVFPPGIYPVNNREQQVDIVEIGFRKTTVSVEKVRNPDGSLKLDDAGEPVVANQNDGINFPSNDGFSIQMDFTAIWGLTPGQAPHAVATFGNIAEVEDKVVQPQIESICRNNGSKYSAVQLLVGEEREKFQQINREEFERVLDEKNIKLLYGLVRHIYIPREVRQPIQSAFIADEVKVTREQEQLTARAEALLRQAEKNVGLETERVEVDTDRQYQSKLAEGDRAAKNVDAKSARMAAAINKETAILKAEAVTLLGEAENRGKQAIEEAKSDKFRLAVEAFGASNAYNDWVFAEGLPDDIELKMMYAGQGTLWTDMKDIGFRATLPIEQAPTKSKK
jgi:hypothetical protein